MRRHIRMGGGICMGIAALVVGGVHGCEAPEERPASVGMSFEKRSEKYFAGLDETVTVVKGLGAGHVIREDGDIQLLSHVVEQDTAAWIAQHGMLTPQVVTYAATVEPNELVPVAFVFDPAIDWSDYFEAQESGDPEWQAQQATILRESIVLTSGSIVEHLIAAGVDPETIRAAKWSPFVHAQVPADLLESVSMIPEVTRVIPDGSNEAVEHSDDTIGNPATFHGTGSLPSGLDGANYRLSVLEPGPCKIRGTHNMINDSVSYSDTGISCSNHSQCGVNFCDQNAASGSRCVGGRCLDGHSTSVASVLMRFTPPLCANVV